MVFLTQLPTFLSATHWKKQCSIHKHTHVDCLPVNSVGLQRKINEEISEEVPPETSKKLPRELMILWQGLALHTACF